MNISKHYIILFFSFFFYGLVAQKHDYIWLMGRNHPSIPEQSGTVIDFNTEPYDLYYEFRAMYFSQVNASMCDTAGHLLFYTNGIWIANALGDTMVNGRGLNPGPSADMQQNYGYILDQGAMALPVPESDSLFFIFHADRVFINGFSDFSRKFYYTKIDISLDDGLGGVLEKNRTIIEENQDLGKVTAVKHANGRDWWLIRRKDNANMFYRILFSKDSSIEVSSQTIGSPIPSPSLGQAVFSPDGNRFACVNLYGYVGEPLRINIYDFDRCTGDLSNPIQFVYADSARCAGAAFSPNNRFLYVSSYKYVYQYDLWAENVEASRVRVAEWDGFVEDDFFATTFYLMQLAPDGKIYINSNSSVSYLHVINNPDSLGLACDLCQHCVDLPSKNSFSLPNFPNYRLGPLEGSPCDTLRQLPVAAWSHTASGPELAFQDQSYHDIRSWQWSFGDGSQDSLPHPIHTYAQEGAYEVCLSVSNPRGTDTRCQTIQVSLTAREEPAGEVFSCVLYPNPATTATTLRATGLPEASATFLLRDALGREVVRQVLAPLGGQLEQSIPVGALPAGSYWYELQCGGKVASGKLGVSGRK